MSTPFLVDSPISDEYAAGLFDGEGTIGLYKSLRPPTFVVCWCRGVSILLCYKPTLEALRRKWGGSLVHKAAQKTDKRRAVWRWRLSSKKDIKRFLAAVLPFLREKQAQARVMLSALEQGVDIEAEAAELKLLKREEF